MVHKTQETPLLQLAQNATGASPNESPLIFIYDDKRVIGARPTSYNSAVAICREIFPGISAYDVLTFHTRELEVCHGQLAEISLGIWGNVVSQLSSITVMKEKKAPAPALISMAGPIATTIPPILPSPGSESNKVSLKIRIIGEPDVIIMDVSPTDQITKIQALLAEGYSKHPTNYFLARNGERMWGTIQASCLGPGDVLEFRRDPKHSAPHIYLFAPKPIRASVTLALSSCWELTGSYPTLPILPRTISSRESITWKVVVHPSKILTNPENGQMIHKLSWEAQKLSQNRNPLLGDVNIKIFNPNEVALNDDNAFILPSSGMSVLGNVLAALGVDDNQARQNFLFGANTFFQSGHEYIALRFLSRDFFEPAAPLHILPLPDVVTRIFVVFQGVKAKDLNEWSGARNRGSSGNLITWCRDSVGGDFDRARDENLFRVVELGGMEITP